MPEEPSNTDDCKVRSPRYTLLTDANLEIIGIRCLTCWKVSYNPNDVANLYCGFCHKFHEEPRV